MKALRPIFYLYRLILSPSFQLAFGIRCRYEVSCSQYMERAMQEHGLLKGAAMGLRRILSCSKWSIHG